MNNASYQTILSTGIILAVIIVALWIILLVNAIIKNPLKIACKSTNSCLENLKELNNSIVELYTKRSDVLLQICRKKINISIRYLRQYSYENDDDRIKGIINRLQSIDLSLSLLKKICFQNGTNEGKNNIIQLVNDIDDIIKLLTSIKNESISYETSYKDLYKNNKE